MEETRDVYVTGTLVWYYYICERQVWLLAHQIAPDQEHDDLTLGRFIHEHSYKREKKEVLLGPAKIDVIGAKDGRLVVGEVKKSSKSKHSIRMQLLFYLDELKKRGLDAYGELRFPKEKRREKVELTQEAMEELDDVKRRILRIMYMQNPPEAKKTGYCRKCAYAELCWA